VLAASTHDWALFFHLLGALLLVAGVTVAGVAFEAARRRSRPDAVAVLLGLTRSGVLLVALGSVLVLAFGLWLVDLEDDLDLGTGWVSAALTLFVVIVILGALGGRRPKRARKLAERLAQDGQPEDPELRALLDDRLALGLNYLAAVLLVVILVLMVFKPGGGS
jgi:uncharacterized membrane protein